MANLIIVIFLCALHGVKGAVFNVKDFGAVGDGNTYDTQAISKALIAVKKNNGGTVLFPSGGVYLTGALNLTSNLIFKVEKGATVLGSWDGNDWNLVDAGAIWPQFGHGSDCDLGPRVSFDAPSIVIHLA